MVVGTSVYNLQGEHLGSIYSIMVDKISGQVAYAVMSFGGFLGIGESYHPLPWRMPNMTFARTAMSSTSTGGGSRERQTITPVVCRTGLSAPMVTGSTSITVCRLTAFEPSHASKRRAMEAPQVERHLAAILSADVEGYMHGDEEETMATLSAHRALVDELIGRHRGRIANTAGDSVLAEFASVLDAVHCAIEIQKTLANANEVQPEAPSMHFRIGINVGDVMVKDGDLFGDGVNVTARLDGLVKGGAARYACRGESATTCATGRGFCLSGRDHALPRLAAGRAQCRPTADGLCRLHPKPRPGWQSCLWRPAGQLCCTGSRAGDCGHLCPRSADPDDFHGAAVNFDGEGSKTVREMVVDNALYWVNEFNLDGLRLDAVHAIIAPGGLMLFGEDR